MPHPSDSEPGRLPTDDWTPHPEPRWRRRLRRVALAGTVVALVAATLLGMWSTSRSVS